MKSAYRRHSKHPPVSGEVSREAWIVLLGIGLAVFLARTGYIEQAALYAAEYATLASFVVGSLFTSVVTTTPAIVAIAEMAPYIAPWKLALVGAAGAVCGDMLIFRFVRSPLAHYIVKIALGPHMRRIGRAFEKGPFWWVTPSIGALVIASPLPDELGLLMMGISEIRYSTFIVLSYVMNAAGIYAIAAVAQSVVG